VPQPPSHPATQPPSHPATQPPSQTALISSLFFKNELKRTRNIKQQFSIFPASVSLNAIFMFFLRVFMYVKRFMLFLFLNYLRIGWLMIESWFDC
jgi:hypothetical protein